MNEPKYIMRDKLKMTQMLLLYFYGRHLQGFDEINYKEVKSFFKIFVYEIRNVNKVIDYLKKKGMVDVKKPSYHTKIIVPLEFGLNRARYYIDHPEKYDTKEFLYFLKFDLIKLGPADGLLYLNNIQDEALIKLHEIEENKLLNKHEVEINKHREISNKIERLENLTYDSNYYIKKVLYDHYQSKGITFIWKYSFLFQHQFEIIENWNKKIGYIVHTNEENHDEKLSNIQTQVNDQHSECVVCMINNENRSNPIITSFIEMKPEIVETINKSSTDSPDIEYYKKTIISLENSVSKYQQWCEYLFKVINYLEQKNDKPDNLTNTLNRFKGRSYMEKNQRNEKSGFTGGGG